MKMYLFKSSRVLFPSSSDAGNPLILHCSKGSSVVVVDVVVVCVVGLAVDVDVYSVVDV